MVGGTVLADTHTWTGTDSTSYWDGDNWTPTGPPGNLDLIYVNDPSLHDTCIVDTTFNVILDGLVLQGDSPTKMTFHVRDKTVNVQDRPCDFFDYGMIKAEKNFTSEVDIDMRGDLWVEIFDSAIVYFMVDARVDISGVTTLNVDDHDSGIFKMDNLYVDAATLGGTTTLKLDAPSSTLTVLELLQLTASTGSDYKAKLWHKAGTLLIQSDDATHAVFDVNGGPNTSRKADIDIDAAFEADECQFSGYVALDVASGLTAYGGDVIFSGGTDFLARKTGSGTFKSGSAP